MKPSNPANNKPIRLALADDHHVVRKALISMFHEYAEIEVLLDAADGQELIEKLKTACVLPDICLLDISMERMDGYETLRAIHAEWPEIKCIVLSQYNSAFHIQRMVQHGAKGYLVKDCEPE
jgi:DNA-binding NarL/FixJ family response regulator